jgi:chemotaxis protein MotB
LLTLLAQELGTIPNHLSIEGHTDSKPYAGRREYGNWELSTDRANAARRLMQYDGLRDDQVSQVRGYADQMLRTPGQPLDPSNRRISVIVQNLDNKPGESGKTDAQAATSTPTQDIPKKD